MLENSLLKAAWSDPVSIRIPFRYLHIRRETPEGFQDSAYFGSRVTFGRKDAVDVGIVPVDATFMGQLFRRPESFRFHLGEPFFYPESQHLESQRIADNQIDARSLQRAHGDGIQMRRDPVRVADTPDSRQG